MSLAYLGLGSNVGDRLENLRAAVGLLGRHADIEVTGISSVYETEPVDDAVGQRDFYNAVVRAQTDLAPRELLSTSKEIERALGREPEGRRHAPRTIDVDLLLIGEARVSESDLVIPHPEVATRRFVLVPLLELDPDLTLPGGTRLADALAALGDGRRVSRVGSLARADHASEMGM